MIGAGVFVGGGFGLGAFVSRVFIILGVGAGVIGFSHESSWELSMSRVLASTGTPQTAG